MNLNKLLERRNAIYGFCAFWILFFHAYRVTLIPDVPVLSDFLGRGNVGVDVFLFLSGVSLSLSAARHHYSGKQWFDFFRRRAFRVLLPYMIVAIPFYCWAALFEHSGGLLRRVALFLLDLSFVTFFIKSRQTIWFVAGIMICYLLFPLFYRFAEKRTFLQKLLLLLVILLFALVAAFLPILRNLEIIWARLAIFVIGVYYGTVKTPKSEEKKPTLFLCILAAATIIVLFWVLSSELVPSHTKFWQLLRWLMNLPTALAILYLFSHFGVQSTTLAWLGALSLEIYMVHITALHIVRFYDLYEVLRGWLYLVLALYTVPMAWLVRKLSSYLQGELGGNTA